MARRTRLDTAYDIVIVGAGTAGCVLATRLSADPSVSVLLVEAGPAADRRLLVQMPIGVGLLIGRTDLGWGYETEPEPGLGGRRLPVPRGKLVGGTGSINGSTHVRAHRLDYDDWVQHGAVGWGYDDLLPYFRRSETSWRGADAQHGGSGPVSVARATERGSFGHRLDAGARGLGVDFPDDTQDGDPTGAGQSEVSIRRGRRHSTAAAYLRPVLRRRPNLTLLTGVQVRRVVFDGTRAAGVELLDHGRLTPVRAGREVVLAAGVYNSPQLLMLSGIGPADHLRSHGLDALVDLPGVGENLHEHPSAPVLFDVSEPVTFHEHLRADRLAWAALRWAVAGTGPLAAMPELLSVYTRSRPDLDRPDGFLGIVAGGFDARPWFPGVKPLPGRHCIALNAVGTPVSRGHVRLRSADPDAAPRIQLNLLQHPDDVAALRETLRMTRRLLTAPEVRGMIAGETVPGPDVRTDEEFEAFLRGHAHQAHHAGGTCAIGTGRDAVVDPSLVVHGTTGLRVADASVMPSSIGANVNATVIAIAERAAALVRGEDTAAAGAERPGALRR
ncbi:choline dehydrogenase [Modestobacter sp. I12A-02628]|uniref:Choline dehydrogenase n=1 Tax=Goekera deserti TaxID=2497753 RepID=A0A7K3WBH3_9ACTN|nr:GMC family oxidoreductase N-terminal domain-containing protein [Goekera deserti]MPQ97423.1 choline dehydrogenase [Goekera deserti]NDI47976.1 choline dehydrogenase [Goekera deserti]NEL53724.1 choline dehydrogenase [Goekera deserti]